MAVVAIPMINVHAGPRIVAHQYDYGAYQLPVYDLAMPQIEFVHPFVPSRKRQIVLGNYVNVWSPFLTVYQPYVSTLKQWVSSPAFTGDAYTAFRMMDRDGNNKLEWNNREIANFIKSIYRSKGLPEPSENTMYEMYKAFDLNNDGSLDVVEAEQLAQGHVSSLVYALGQTGGYKVGRRSFFEAPLPRHGQNGSEYAVGDVLEVWSDSRKIWMLSKVSCIHTDGRCDCNYLQNGTLAPTGEIKTITLADQAAKMRQVR